MVKKEFKIIDWLMAILLIILIIWFIIMLTK